MKMDPQSTIHVIDFEGNRKCGVIEYGVVTLSGKRIERVHTRFCQTQGEITYRDIKQHGITREATLAQPPFADEWELFNGLRQSGVLAAHHASVENRLMKHTWPYPKRVAELGIVEWGPWIDTRVLYSRIFPGLEDYKLGALVEVFRLKGKLQTTANIHVPDGRRKYHCALYDALASALLLIHLFEQPGFERLTLDWLLEYSVGDQQSLNEKRQSSFDLE